MGPQDVDLRSELIKEIAIPTDVKLELKKRLSEERRLDDDDEPALKKSKSEKIDM